MPRPGSSGSEVYYGATAPLAPSIGDFWFDSSGTGVLNFRTSAGWLVVAVSATSFDTLSNAVSALSQAVSVLSQAVSVTSQAVSVLSNAVSVVSQAVSVVSTAASNALSVANAASNAASIVSQALSNEISNRTSADNVLSNAISVVSQQVSIISQQVSVISQQVSVISQALSVLSQAVSVISAGLGAVQMKVVGDVQGVSALALINISGLSVSVAAAGVYQIESMVLFQMSVADGMGFGLTFPAMTAAGIKGVIISAAGVAKEVVAFANEAASGSIILSAAPTAALSTLMARIDGVFAVSTTGTVQVQARTSANASPVNIQKGSYVRAYKVA